MELFKLMGTIAINNSEANSALDETSGKGQQAESKLGKVFSGIGKGAAVVGKAVGTGMVVAGTAMAGLTVKALNLGGELEQNMGGSEAVFKDYAGKMQETAKSAFENMGLSTAEFLGTANKMGALFQGAGFSIQESSDLSASAMQRAADVASIMGIDTSAAMEAIAGAAKGNFTMMDNLGVAMNDTTLNAYAMEKGINKTTQEMTNQEKIGLAMEMFMEKTAYAAGNYAKENETLAGSLGTAKSALTNFLDGSGSVEQLVGAFTNAANVIVKNVTEIAPRLVSGLSEVVNQLIPQITPLIQSLLPVIIEGAVNLINGLVQAMPTIISAIMACLPALIDGITQIMNAVIAALPMLMETLISALPTLIPQLINGLVSMIVTLCTSLPQIIQPIIDYLPEIIIAIVDALITNLPALIEGAVQLVVGLVAALPEIIMALIEAMPTVITSMVEGLIAAAPLLIDGFVEIWNGVNVALDEIINGIIQFVVDIWNTLVNLLEPILEGIKTIITKAWEAAKTNISTALNTIKNLITTGWNAVKTVTSTVWNAVKSGISSVWNGIKSGVSNAINSVKSTVTNIWNGIKSTTTKVWDGVKSAIQKPIEKARDLVKAAIDKIKGFFDFEFKWPNIKMPHFSISPSGWRIGDLLDGVIPKLSIDWYAKAMKDPMVMTDPTIFGYNARTGSLMGGGEAGAEVVSGADTLMNMIGAAVESKTNAQTGQIVTVLEVVIRIMQDMLSALLAGQTIVLDKRELGRTVRELA